MADDRIQLNLVLNEATVSAVEGRVRNLVNRLNNQNISVNINGQNFDNLINKANTLIQRMQTINATPVNINANLTSAQQQYRLETERMRVSQQLELSRQRTLQTENQAISALAQQNRTLTVNNNITHQIEQGAQNIGNNMNVAGGHARDFVDYLADGVRYIIVYRSLYEIMNQVGEAFSEMKNVDKELISVRKTTGMAENEIEKIRKASYGVATEYGRTASEYLGSVSEFARGGYKELSTELAKVSLLTQNVGDVSADSANKMLLSVDAAYKLKGNVTELTNVVNGLNNIANLNPTSMQKMADGIQVSASMAKVAGLEISDLVALIGTGTAVTQREGGEIARAIRTILMNIRAQKGKLEDGTVIDDESIAKAEAALKGVGIATKEVVNGVRELRDPMDILDELAGKWSTLNTEAQSVVLESLANKRQANVLAAILENYEMVDKMQSEYFNSANSAVKENELYLQGWEATQKRVSAKWTEFIANMADTAVITGSLNALYGVLVALDTPIGRIATSIVLVNTALAVSGRLWQAIRARSIVADILSMGVAERNLGTAIQLVSGHLGRQALAWATSPLGMATIAVAGITLITSAIEKNSQKLEENAQKAGEAYDKVKSNMNELDSLIKQYNDLQLSNEWNNTPVETKKQLHEDINRLLGDEADKIDILNGKYKETTEELFKQRMAKLPEEEKTAFDNEQAKGKTLWDTAYWNGGGGAGGYNYGTMQATDTEKKYIEKYDNVFDEKWYSAGHGAAASDYVIRFDNFNDFMTKYEEAKKMLQELYNDGMGESNLYKGLNEFIAKFDTKVTDYKNAVEELEKTKAGQKLGNYITQNVGGYIDNLEEYNKVVDWVKNNFTGEDKNSALSFLNSYFSEYAEKVTETSDLLSGDYSSAIKSVSATLSTLQEKYDELKSAQDEYNSTGAISAETMQKLIDNDLLQYLDYSSGKLKINTDALLAEGEAAKVNAIQKLQDAMATDLMNLATGKTDQLSNTAKTAIANLGSAAETTGNKAQTAASKLAGFAIAAQAAKDGAEGNLTGMSVEDFNAQANAIISAYTSAANSIGGITIKSPKTSKGSSSSSNKNDALEKHLKDAERRYKIHQDETKYIEELDYALNKLVKTDEERLEILDKIEDARKDYADNRIKDLEHEKEMLKNMYGDNYDTSYIDRSIQQIHHEEAERLRALGYDDSSDEIQEHQSGWWDKQNELLDNMSLQYENRIKDIEHARDMFLEQNPLGDTTSFYKQLQDEYHKEAERLRALDPEKYKEEIQELQLLWHDAQNEIADWSLSNSERWINERNLYGDWDKFADNEVAAWKRVLDRFRKEHANELDKIKDIEEKYFNAIKNELINSLNFNSSQIGSLHTLLQSYYDMTNSIAEAQHEINKELDASLTMYEYLDEETRKLLFNQEDYNILSEKLLDLQYEADKLQRQYNRDVLNATEENLEEITAQYEMQYETMLKKYEIARAELNVAKKRQQLDNVLNERNVRMLINGQWTWVANTQDVLNAKAELADAEYAAQVAKHTLDQTKSLNNLTSAQNVLTTTINNVESGVIAFNSNLGDITKGLGEIVTTDIPALKSIINDVGSAIKNYNGNVNNKDTTYNGNASSGTSSKGGSSGVGSSSAPQNNATATIPGIGEVGIHINDSGKTTTTGLPVGTVVHTGGGDYKITGGTGGNYTSIKVKNKYADGTNFTKPGSALMGEDGKEIYIDNNGHYIPIEQPTLFSEVKAGGIVFNQDQMKSLHTLWDMSNLVKMPDYSNLVNRYDSHNMTTNNDYSVTIKDLVVDNGVNGQELVDALRRYVAIH